MTEDPVLNAPVESLQLMLQTIAYAQKTIPIVNPDGIFGPQTTQTLREFQRRYGLQDTGVADEATYRRVAQVYAQALEQISPSPAPVYHFPTDLIISRGQYHPHIYLTAAMFSAISQVLGDFRPAVLSGILDDTTVENLKFLQERSGLPVTGTLDKLTWNRLNLLYRSLFDRAYLPAQG